MAVHHCGACVPRSSSSSSSCNDVKMSSDESNVPPSSSSNTPATFQGMSRSIDIPNTAESSRPASPRLDDILRADDFTISLKALDKLHDVKPSGCSPLPWQLSFKNNLISRGAFRRASASHGPSGPSRRRGRSSWLSLVEMLESKTRQSMMTLAG